MNRWNQKQEQKSLWITLSLHKITLYALCYYFKSLQHYKRANSNELLKETLEQFEFSSDTIFTYCDWLLHIMKAIGTNNFYLVRKKIGCAYSNSAHHYFDLLNYIGLFVVILVKQFRRQEMNRFIFQPIFETNSWFDQTF